MEMIDRPRRGIVTRGSTALTMVVTSDATFRATGAGRAETARVAVSSAKESRSALLNLTAVGESVVPSVGRVLVPGSVRTKSGLFGICATDSGVWSASPTACDDAFAA